MRYLCLIYGNEAVDAQLTPEQREEQMSEYFAFSQAVGEAGALLGGEELQPTSMSTTVRVRNGSIQMTDGPFAETKEQLGGFYLIQCENLDEALQWAAKIPGARDGCVEVRPVVEWDSGQE
ncbi:MAG: YciI family protein [Caldilineaceae bacterium]|nr:YciI family protein [Caldilineaceae bacterium]